MKAESFANLFKGAGELSSNKKAYSALADAVEEIRDILGSQGSSIGDAVGGAISNAFGGGDDKKSSKDNSGGINKSMNKINSTLSQLNNTMGNLPIAISNLVDPDS